MVISPLRFVCLMINAMGIKAVSKYNEPIIEVFSAQIYDHVDPGYKIFIPVKALHQEVTSNCSNRCKHCIEQCHLHHGYRHVASTLECKLAIKCKVP